MPYISSKNDRRQKLQEGDDAQSAGELNYQIFHFIKHNHNLSVDCIHRQVKEFVEKFLKLHYNYQGFNDITGCLIRCAKEIERRLKIDIECLFVDILNSYDNEINEYEDVKIKENSDVE